MQVANGRYFRQGVTAVTNQTKKGIIIMCENYMGFKIGDRVQLTRRKSINHLTAGGLSTAGIIVSIDTTAEGGYEGVHFRPFGLLMGDGRIVMRYSANEIAKVRGLRKVESTLTTPYHYGEEGVTLTLCDHCMKVRGMEIGLEWAGFKATAISGVLAGKCQGLDCDFELTS